MTVVNRFALLCKGKSCCPEIVFYKDGSMELVDKDDGRDQTIRLSSEQTETLGSILSRVLRGLEPMANGIVEVTHGL